MPLPFSGFSYASPHAPLREQSRVVIALCRVLAIKEISLKPNIWRAHP
jgi:hypothetical protein